MAAMVAMGGMVATAGMAVTGAIIMAGAVGVGEDGAAGGVRASTSISDGAIRIMGMATIRITGMATTAHITATIAPTTIAATTRTIAHTVTTATTDGTIGDITGSAVALAPLTQSPPQKRAGFRGNKMLLGAAQQRGKEPRQHSNPGFGVLVPVRLGPLMRRPPWAWPRS